MFSIWSSISGLLECIDYTEQEIIDAFVEMAVKDAKRSVIETLEEVKTKEKPYYQFTKDWDEAVSDTLKSRDATREWKSVLKEKVAEFKRKEVLDGQK